MRQKVTEKTLCRLREEGGVRDDQPPMATTALIQSTQLCRSFERRTRPAGSWAALRSFVKPVFESKKAVTNVSFEIQEGSIVGLVGANGAGKTTLLKMCAGVLHPTSGSVSVMGFRPAERKPAFLRQIGMVMGQKSQLWTDLPANETLELLGAIYDIPSEVFRKRLDHLCNIFGVKEHLGVQVRRLSLGERMKFEIIASLLHQPKLLILDEPTIGLDVVAKHNIRDFILNSNREFGTTIILSSHDMSDIQQLCSKLMIIGLGQLVFDGPIESFSEKYGSVDSSGNPEQALEELVHKLLVGQAKS